MNSYGSWPKNELNRIQFIFLSHKSNRKSEGLKKKMIKKNQMNAHSTLSHLLVCKI